MCQTLLLGLAKAAGLEGRDVMEAGGPRTRKRPWRGTSGCFDTWVAGPQ